MTNATIKTPATPKSPAKVKPVTKAVVTFNTALEQLVTGIQEHLNTKQSIKLQLDIMRKTKVKIGSIKSKCQFAIATMEQLKTLVNPATNKPYVAAYLSVQLSNIRKCLNNPDLEYSPNMTRVKGTAKPKGSAPSKGTAPEALPDAEKTCGQKVTEQLKNAVTIIQASENAEFDIVAVKALIERAMALINQ